MKLKKSPKKQNKSQQIPDEEFSRLAFEKLHEVYASVDAYQLEEDGGDASKLVPKLPSTASLGSKPPTTLNHNNGSQTKSSKRQATAPRQGRTAPSVLEDSSSQVNASDPLPDSATFFEELPIASNNDFEIATESTQSRLTLTHSIPTHSASMRSLPSAGMEVDLPFSDSLGSVSTQRSARAGRELRRLFEPSLQSASELDHTSSSSQISTYTASKPNMPAPQADPSTPTPRRSARLSLGPR
jgi:hypothetical protein